MDEPVSLAPVPRAAETCAEPPEAPRPRWSEAVGVAALLSVLDGVRDEMRGEQAALGA